ncbi:MAG: hypothetical protein RL358_269 [Pseudomonadota bacterium]
MKKISGIAWVAMALLTMTSAHAVTCTSKANGNWGTTGTWDCGHVPTTTDTVVLASNFTVVLDAAYSTAGITVNSGATLSDTAGSTLTVTGNLVNNGTFTTSGSGKLDVTGAASVISGSGAYAGFRLYTSGATPQIAAGSVLNFSGKSRIYAGRNVAGTTVASSLLTINGTINSTIATATGVLFRIYANSTIVGTTGVINASVSGMTFYAATTKITNNGSVSLNIIKQNATTNGWTQGTNSSLTLTASSTVGVLTASATGNTVTYTSPAAPVTPLNNTYFNLAGTGVICPHSYIVLGTQPCSTGAGTVTMNPGSCVNVMGTAALAWAPTPTTNVNLSDNVYATATVNGTSNYLKCTGYNFAIPSAATILGVVVNVERKSSSSTRTTDGAMRLVKAGVIGTVDRAKTTVYSTTDVVETHGTAADLWGVAWTPADINSATFGAAFAAKTTRSRTVSVDHMPITVTYSTPAAAPHHIQIEHSGAGLTCAPEQLTVKACANAACSAYFTTANVTGNITSTSGATVPFTISSGGTGQTTVSLAVTTAQTVTLATSAVTPTTTSGCTNLAGGTACNLTFTKSSFCVDAVEVGAAVGTSIHTKLSNTAFSLDMKTVSGNNNTQSPVQVELVDASAVAACASYPQLNTQSVSFTGSVKTVSFTYANAVKSAKVRMTAGGSASCSSDAFSIRPTSLAISSTANSDATGTNATALTPVKAGTNFTLTATGLAGYNGLPVIDTAQIAAHAGAPVVGLLTGTFAVANATTGVATANTVSYDEVGYFRFNVNGVVDTTFADMDRLDGDCTNDYSNTLVNGKYGCYFGNAAATPYFGRFIPNHFDTVVTDQCAAFTYSGQPFPLEIQAKEAAGSVTQNYQGAYAKSQLLSDALNPATLGSFTPTSIAASGFALGLAAADGVTLTMPAYAFAVVKTVPTSVKVRVTEVNGDAVSSAAGAEGLATIRSGRVWIGNAYGSELLDLSVPVLAQYWNGSAYVLNVDDDVASCSSFSAPTSMTLTPSGTTMPTMPYVDPAIAGNVGFSAGNGGLLLSAPGVAGVANVTLTMPVWLQYVWSGTTRSNPTARATFGVYSGNKTFIYRGRRGR